MSILRKDYRHSASRGNAFIDSPAHWIITELYGYKELPNPRMLMGLAAESAAMEGLKLDLSEDKVREQAAKDFDTLYSYEHKLNEGTDEVKEFPEYHWCQEIAVRFVNSLK